MSAPNFARENLNTIYAFDCIDEFDLEDIVETVNQSFIESRYYFSLSACYLNNLSSCRSYPETILDEGLRETKVYNNIEIEICIIPFIRSGYYSGGNIDFYIKLFIDGLEYDTDDEVDYTEFLSTRYASFADKWADKTIEKLHREAERVIAKVSKYKLVTLGVFSNGEAIYKSI
jgi:hypothetical protein